MESVDSDGVSSDSSGSDDDEVSGVDSASGISGVVSWFVSSVVVSGFDGGSDGTGPISLLPSSDLMKLTSGYFPIFQKLDNSIFQN